MKMFKNKKFWSVVSLMVGIAGAGAMICEPELAVQIKAGTAVVQKAIAEKQIDVEQAAAVMAQVQAIKAAQDAEKDAEKAKRKAEKADAADNQTKAKVKAHE